MISIIEANTAHIDEIVPLFDGYRVFYGQDSDQLAARNFLKERFLRNETLILLARAENKAVGFTQLYTSYSSVSLQPLYILNDLYVLKSFRNKGIGEALLNEAKQVCVQKGYKGLALETAVDNPAQKLYEKLGWKKDTDCFHYFWTCKARQE